MNKNNNDVVYIHLDKPRVLRYGHAALKRLTALTGKSLEEVEMSDMSDLEALEQIVYCGLLSDSRENGEVLKIEDMESLLDQAPSYAHIMECVQQAFAAAFGGAETTEGNAPAPVANPAK